MTDAVSILPVEVWKIFLSHVEEDDPNDLFSCYQTCTLFQSNLQESRTSWLFPLIYPCLHNQLKWKVKDVMSCRLVCRSWAKGVDTYMESHHFQPISCRNPSWLRTVSLSGIPPLGRQLTGFGAIFREGHCEAFKADFKGSNRNPFISRTLRLSCVNFPQALEFIQKFGCHLWALYLDVKDFGGTEEGITVTRIVKHLWDILEWVPSLKHFELGGLGSIRCSGVSDEDVQSFFEIHKPPNLPHLASLHILNSSRVHRGSYLQLRNILIRHFQSPQVTILYGYDRSALLVPGMETRRSLNLGWNMKSLWFSWDTGAPDFQLHTQALSHINCPLETLKVQVKSFSDMDQLLIYILKFKDTLRLLSLTIKNCQYENSWSSHLKYFSLYIYQLEQLERLEISFTNKTINLTEFDLRRIYSISLLGGEGGQGHFSVKVLKKQRVGRHQIDEFGSYPLCFKDRFRAGREILTHLPRIVDDVFNDGHGRMIEMIFDQFNF